MTHREYYRRAREIAKSDPDWLRDLIAATERGDKYLRPFHAGIIRLALRNA